MDAGWIIENFSHTFGGNARQQQPVAALADRLFTSAVMHGICWEDLGCAQIMSSDCDMKLLLADVCKSQQIDLCFSSDLAEIALSNVMIADIDSFGEILRLIDQLRVVRGLNPSRSAILLSENFTRDDFKASRLRACVASMRVPFSFARLKQAFVEADINDTVWQDRQVWPDGVTWATQAQTVVT